MSNLINCLIGKINKLEKKVCKLQNGQGGPCEVCPEVKLNLYIITTETPPEVPDNVNLNVEYYDCDNIKNIRINLEGKIIPSCLSMNPPLQISLTDVKIDSIISLDIDTSGSTLPICALVPLNNPIYVNSNCNEYSVYLLFNMDF